MFGTQFGKLSFFFLQNFLQLADLELAQFRNRLHNAPFFIARERNASAQQRQKHLFVKLRFRMRGHHDTVVTETGGNAAKSVVADLSENLYIFFVVAFLSGRSRLAVRTMSYDGGHTNWRWWRSLVSLRR